VFLKENRSCFITCSVIHVWLMWERKSKWFSKRQALSPDNWERPDGRAPRGSGLTISAHLSDRGAGTAPPRWGGETLVQKLPPRIMSLLIGPFPNGLPVGPYPSLLGLSVSPTKVLLGYLGSFRILLLSCSSKLPVGPRSCWISWKWTGRIACQNWSNTPRYPCSLPPGSNHCKD